jgi:hypothetical protein
MLVITCLPEVWGSNPVATPTGSRNGRGLSAATGTADGEVLTFAAGYGGRCQRRDTVSPGSEEPYFGGDQPGLICLRSQSSLAAKVMEMKLH